MLKALLPFGLTTLVHSLRIKWIGDPLPEKCIVAFWHSRMIAGWWVTREHAVALISKSEDGEYLNSILTKWNYKTVRGSSSTSGKEALEEAINIIRSGNANRLVITPDGPRGPQEIFKRGAFIAAQELHLPLYFLFIEYKHAIHLRKSWDEFQIPYPFSTVYVSAHQVETLNFPLEHEEQKSFLLETSRKYNNPIGAIATQA